MSFIFFSGVLLYECFIAMSEKKKINHFMTMNCHFHNKQNTARFMVSLYYMQFHIICLVVCLCLCIILTNQISIIFYIFNQTIIAGLCLFSQDVPCLQCQQWWIINLSENEPIIERRGVVSALRNNMDVSIVINLFFHTFFITNHVFLAKVTDPETTQGILNMMTPVLFKTSSTQYWLLDWNILCK